MSEQSIAARLLDKCRRRLSGADIELCEAVIDGLTVDDMADWQRRSWNALNTEFAADLKDLREPDRDFEETSTPTLL
jgi:hypothetical protein